MEETSCFQGSIVSMMGENGLNKQTKIGENHSGYMLAKH